MQEQPIIPPIDRERMLTSKHPETCTDEERAEFDAMFCGETAKDNYKILNNFVKSMNDSIPPLIHSYIELSSSMKTFGTTFDPDFGDCYDTAMIITINDIYEPKKKRYIESYFDQK